MKSAIRNAATLSRYKSPRHTNTRLFCFLNPNPQNVVVSNPTPAWCHTLCGGKTHAPPQMEKQFESFQQHLEESGRVHDRIKGVATEIESTNRRIHSLLVLVHQSRPMPLVLDKVKGEIDVLKGLFSQLVEIVSECSEQYYRFHGDWKSEMQVVISLLAFMHWLETDTLLGHVEAGQKLGLDKSEFRIDVEDYLIGICFMSNELPRYVVNRVTAGDFDCPRKVMKFLADLHAAFRMLNLRNDFLRKKFDSMKYDLRKVEEVYYDVKIRGLVVNGDLTAKGTEGQQ